jgi:hypothetical protein
MSSLALAESSPEAYAVDFAPKASRALTQMLPDLAAELRRRLREIAEVAATSGGLGFMLLDGAGSTLHLEISAHVVSYVVDDARRTLTVLSIVPAQDE